MISHETLSLYITICVLAPLIGAFTILFLFIFEKKMEALETQTNKLVLEQELQKSKFEILSQKIQPHFFFNTLNIITGLARLNRKTELIHAVETLSKFLKRKYVISSSLATIEEELLYTKYYLDIQKLRFGDRLHVTIDAHPDTLPMMIPTFVIQTFTENCFKHSFEKYEGKAQLIITIKPYSETIQLEVWNSKGSMPTQRLPELADEKKGIGLKNIKDRLHLLYPNNTIQLKLFDNSDGTKVFMEWPIQLPPNRKE
ncbi:sensor histidine kinase [Virgibacillus sp. MG-45]|uniref:sensor histidine kinase n=1 Tax=Virgibacillus sp. MG-45 TaxID=3102791 RepID=UPI002ED85EAA